MEESKCEVCGSFLDAEDLFCSNCGTENPNGIDASGGAIHGHFSADQSTSITSFRCEQCGASMSYDPAARQLRCPFCGNERVTPKQTVRILRPSSVVPFTTTQRDAEALIRDWLTKGFWRPGDAAENSVINKIAPVFVPYWIFSANVESAWTADSSQLPAGARGDWRPVSGTTERVFSGVLVCASGVLFPNEVQEIAPFDLSKAVPPEKIDLVHAIVEEFRLTKRDARQSARGEIDRITSNEVRRSVQGSTRNIHVNNLIQNMSSIPVLLPVWIMAYTYNKKTFRVLINGQTREIFGEPPFSNTKLVVVVAIVFALVLFIIVLFVFGSLASHRF